MGTLTASSANMLQCILTGGNNSSPAISLFVSLADSSQVFPSKTKTLMTKWLRNLLCFLLKCLNTQNKRTPLSFSIARLLLANAEPHPNVCRMGVERVRVNSKIALFFRNDYFEPRFCNYSISVDFKLQAHYVSACRHSHKTSADCTHTQKCNEAVIK